MKQEAPRRKPTPLLQKYRAQHGRRPSKEGVACRRVAELAGVSVRHVYNVARGVRVSAPVKAMLDDVLAGKM